jgi:hypothetical protein
VTAPVLSAALRHTKYGSCLPGLAAGQEASGGQGTDGVASTATTTAPGALALVGAITGHPRAPAYLIPPVPRTVRPPAGHHVAGRRVAVPALLLCAR